MLDFLRKQKKHKRIFQAIIFIMIIAVFFVNVKFALAGDAIPAPVNFVLAGVGGAVSLVIGWIALLLIAVIGALISVVDWVLIQVAQFNNIINVPTVIVGWVIVRDLCNMSFILILLIIAFATILRQENFSAKKMLPKLLLMAILINFSRSIFGLLIDFSQIIMLTFVNAFAAGGGHFIDAFRTDKLLAIKGVSTWDEKAAEQWGVVMAIIAGVLAAIITLIVVSVMLAVLVARIVMLWIYTIFSPLIFLGFAFTPLQKYTGKLWEDFTKQLVVGPVLAFFIWLALTTASSSTDKMLGEGGNLTVQVCTGAGAFFCEGNFQKFIIVIGLLMGGLMVAQSMGGAAGSIAGKGLDWAKKSLAAPVKTAGGIAKTWGPWASRKMAKLSQKGGLWSLAMLGSPKTLKEGWERRRKEDEQEAFPRASAKFQDFLNKRFNPLLGMGVEGKGKIGEKTAKMKQKLESIPYLGPIARAASGKKTYNEKIAFESEVASKQNEIAKANLPEVGAAQAMIGARGEVEKLAWTRQIMALNRGDDVARVLGKMFKKELPGLIGRGGAYNGPAFREFLRDDFFKEFGKQKANEFMAHLAEYCEDIGKPRGFALGKTDAETGEAVPVNTPEEALDLQTMRMGRGDAEKLAATLETAQFRTQEAGEKPTTDIVTGKTVNSSFSEMTDEGKLIFKALQPGVAEQYNKSRKVQVRFMKVAGIEPDSKTKQISSESIDYGKLAECYNLNSYLTESLLTKAKLSKDELTNIQTNLNRALTLMRSTVNADFSKSSFGELSGRGGKP